MACLGSRQRGCDGLLVAHFADQDDIGCFSQGTFETCTEIIDVETDLSLMDDGLGISETIFNGILKGDDMSPICLIDVLDDS